MPTGLKEWSTNYFIDRLDDGSTLGKCDVSFDEIEGFFVIDKLFDKIDEIGKLSDAESIESIVLAHF